MFFLMCDVVQSNTLPRSKDSSNSEGWFKNHLKGLSLLVNEESYENQNIEVLKLLRFHLPPSSIDSMATVMLTTPSTSDHRKQYASSFASLGAMTMTGVVTNKVPAWTYRLKSIVTTHRNRLRQVYFNRWTILLRRIFTHK